MLQNYDSEIPLFKGIINYKCDNMELVKSTLLYLHPILSFVQWSVSAIGNAITSTLVEIQNEIVHKCLNSKCGLYLVWFWEGYY